MKNKIVKFRNAIAHFKYKYFFKPIFFRIDPEDVHNFTIRAGHILGKFWPTRIFFRIFLGFKDKSLEQTILGINFKNPVGLAAGFDKDAELLDILPAVGFGFAEIGSITGEPCPGNPRPRLWRLKESRGLVVYYGLKNKGCEIISEKLKNKKFSFPVGISVAMTNCKENLERDKAIADYAKAFGAFADIGDYITVNVSCPNAEGGQPFMDPEKLNRLLTSLDKIQTERPVFIKISPDLSRAETDLVLDVARVHRVQGIICSNLTKKRENEKILEKEIPDVGGISGKPVEDLTERMISYIYQREGKKFILVGCGGIFSAEDAYRKIKLGATLVQLITGMIFEGPQLISEINRGLAELLKKDGFKNISEAIGADYRNV